MVKKSIYPIKIKNILKNKSLNLKDLMREVRTQLSESNKGFNKNSFFNALIELLKNNEIAITGYDFEVHNIKDERIQSFKKDGIIFEWVKISQTYILWLLNQLQSSKEDEVKNAEKKLRNSFEKKFRQYEKQEIDQYYNIAENVVPYFLKDYIEMYEEGLKNAIKRFKSKNPENEYTQYIITRNKRIIKKLNEEYNESKDAIVWVLDPNFKESLNYQKNVNMPWEIRDYSISDIEVGPDELYPLLDRDFITKEQYLEKIGFFKPIEKNSDEIISLFNNALFFLNVQKKYNYMKYVLSRALSDEKDSIELFNIFIKSIDPQNIILKNNLIKETEKNNEIDKIKGPFINRIEENNEIDNFFLFIKEAYLEWINRN